MVMHEAGTSKRRGTVAELAKDARVSMDESRAAIDELDVTKAADVTKKGGIVTLTNRRRQREEIERLGARLRKRKQRSHKDVTNTPSSSSSSNTTPTPPGEGGGDALRSALKTCGVHGDADLAACDAKGLTAWDVFAVSAKVARDKDVRNRAAVLTHRLLNGYTPTILIKPLELSSVANTGRIWSICGHRVVGQVKHNPEFVYFADDSGVQQQIAASELKPANITFTEETRPELLQMSKEGK